MTAHAVLTVAEASFASACAPCSCGAALATMVKVDGGMMTIMPDASVAGLSGSSGTGNNRLLALGRREGPRHDCVARFELQDHLIDRKAAEVCSGSAKHEPGPDVGSFSCMSASTMPARIGTSDTGFRGLRAPLSQIRSAPIESALVVQASAYEAASIPRA